MPVRLRRRLPLSRRRTASTAVTAVLVGGTFAGLLSVTGVSTPSTAHAAPEAKAPAATRGTKAPAGAPETQTLTPMEQTPPGTGAPTSAQGAAKPDRGAKPATSVMQIVAHPDDDLFFMNPDISQTIRSATP